jgi:phospholipase C
VSLLATRDLSGGELHVIRQLTVNRRTRRVGFSAATLVGIGALVTVAVAAIGNSTPVASPKLQTAAATTKTPIQHLVVIFEENESFDQQFGTYPVATNPAGEIPFTALPGTPSVNGLVANSLNGNINYLASNPNGVNPQRLDPGPNADGIYNTNLDSHGSNAGIDDLLTCSQNHNYQPEQQAVDGGKMDDFPTAVGTGSGAIPEGAAEGSCNADTDLDFYDGNTFSGYWNYAQHDAMSDNYFGTTYGPSTPGAINIVSGDTGNFNLANNCPVTDEAVSNEPPFTPTASSSTCLGTTPTPAAFATAQSPDASLVTDGDGAFSDINDGDPYYDDCSSTTANIGINDTSSTGVTDPNVGDLLSENGISWGWFEGGFAPVSSSGTPTPATNGLTINGVSGIPEPGYPGGPAESGVGTSGVSRSKATCGAVHNVGAALGGTNTGSQPYGTKADYVQHHEPFQYYATTANPAHLLPTSLSAVGTDTQSFTGSCYGCGQPEFNTANHQYDISEFNSLVSAIQAGTMPASSLPAVSYLKAPQYEDEHPADSDPIDAQKFVTSEINSLMATPAWASTAVVLTYDDSDGWYDHVFSGAQTGGKVLNQSSAGGGPTTEGDDEAPAVCGGNVITGSALTASVGTPITVTSGTNDNFEYQIGSGPEQTLSTALSAPSAVTASSLTAGAYGGPSYTSVTNLADAISADSGGEITAQVNSNKLVLTANAKEPLSIIGADGSDNALSVLGLSAGASSTPALPSLTNDVGQPENGRCGFGPRLPLQIISPYAKANFVDNTETDQASVVNFIEYNWGVGTIPGSAAQLLTNPATTFDLSNMFDFTAGATDTAGPNPYILNTTTFEPLVSWSAPAAITYGTALSSTQLDASASDPAITGTVGTFTYPSESGEILGVGTHAISATFTPANGVNYPKFTTSVNITVNPAPLTVTASGGRFGEGESVPKITPSYSGFVNGDSASSLTSAPSCYTYATSTSKAGNYKSVCTDGESANYTFTYVNGTVTVVGKPLVFPKTAPVKKAGVPISITCPKLGLKCTGEVEIKDHGVIIAQAKLSDKSGKTEKLTLKATKVGKKVLAGVSTRHELRVTLSAPSEDDSSKAITLT